MDRSFDGFRGALLGLLLFLLGVAAVALALRGTRVDGSIWEGFALGTDGTSARYCERNRFEAWSRQPSNTWSNLAYGALGSALLGVALQDFRRRGSSSPLIRQPGFTVAMGLSLLVLCAGSFFFHASLTLPAQKLDMTGTYAAVLTLGSYLVFRALSLASASRESQWACLCLLGLLSTDVLFFVTDAYLAGTVLLPSLMVAVSAGAVLLERKLPRRASRLLLWAALGATALSGVCWVLDVSKVGCAPDGPFQFHAAWHLLTAAGIGAAWLYFRGEGPAA